MAYKPILFYTEMVKAILEGRKTQTRRIIKPQPTNPRWNFISWFGWDDGHGRRMKVPCKPGDILWVRETHFKDAGRYMYFANYAKDEKFYRDGQEVKIRWTPSVHMPKEAARIFLRVKDVRVKRLQDITEEQAEKEGCSAGRFPVYGPSDGFLEPPDEWDAVEDFQRVWNETIKPDDYDVHGWEANPWVWVIEFERCEKPKEW